MPNTPSVATAWSGLTSGKNFRHTILTQAFSHQNHLESMLHQHVYKTLEMDKEHAQTKELMQMQHKDNRDQRRHEFRTTLAQHGHELATTQAQQAHEIATTTLGHKEAGRVRRASAAEAAAGRAHEVAMKGMEHTEAEAGRQHTASEAAASRAHELAVGQQHADQFANHVTKIVDQAKGDTEVTISHGDTSATFTRKLRTGGTRKPTPDA